MYFLRTIVKIDDFPPILEFNFYMCYLLFDFTISYRILPRFRAFRGTKSGMHEISATRGNFVTKCALHGHISSASKSRSTRP